MIKKSALFIILVLYPLLAFTAEDQPEKTALTLHQYISRVLKNSHFNQFLNDELTAAYAEKLKAAPGEFILSLMTQYQFNYDQALFQGIGGSVGLSKFFSRSGTKLSGTYSILPKITSSNTDSSSTGSNSPSPATAASSAGQSPMTGTQKSQNLSFNETMTSKLQINLEQALIKNAFGQVSRINNQIAGLEKKAAVYQIIEAYEDYLATLISLYLQWYTAYENLIYSQKAYQDSLLLWEDAREKQQYHVANAADVNKSQLQVILKQEQQIIAQNKYQSLSYQIQQLLGHQDRIFNFYPQFSPLFLPLEEWEHVLDQYEKNSRQMQINRNINANQQLSLKVKINDLLPELNLFTNYTFSGQGYGFETKPTHDFKVGLNLSYALPQPGFLADFRKQKNDSQAALLEQKNDFQDFKSRLHEMYHNLITQQKLSQLARQKMTLSTAVLEDEKKTYQQGSTSLTDLISAYNSLQSNQQDWIKYFTQYYQYYIDWLRLNDLLINDAKEVKPDLDG